LATVVAALFLKHSRVRRKFNAVVVILSSYLQPIARNEDRLRSNQGVLLMTALCGFALSSYYNKVKLVLLEKGVSFAGRDGLQGGVG
jgi:hypothetical protein